MASDSDSSTLYGFDYWKQVLASIGRFEAADGRRAPYKPLLLLWLIGRVVNGHGGVVAFRDAEAKLKQLLSAYRLGRTEPRSQFPFVYLGTTSEIWSVRDSDGNDIVQMSEPLDATRSAPARETVSFLKAEAVGSLHPRFVTALGEPELRDAIVNELLNAEFPTSQHESILAKAELLWHVRLAPPRRDPNFRESVLMAYEFRCSFCDFNARLRDQLVGLDAAHVRMHAKDGPSTLSNGISLCTQHHRLFDAGALGLRVVGGERKILVSQHLLAGDDLVSLSGREMRPPQRGYEPPASDHVEWHYENLFVQPERQLV